MIILEECEMVVQRPGGRGVAADGKAVLRVQELQSSR